MLLCLDIGNTQVHAGIFDGDTLRAQFRKSTSPLGSIDELGVFFLAVLREKGLNPQSVNEVAICSVVPRALHPVRGACVSYFNCEPFILQAGVKTGLKVRYRNPLEVGADRIANAMAATQRHPQRDVIVVDCGTATTFDAVTATGDYLGGAILPGVGISAEMLASRTARLPSVEIVRPETVLGRSTAESIQSGLYFGQIGAIREITKELTREVFAGRKPHLIGTGGFSGMFESEGLFDEIEPELVLWGLKYASELNSDKVPLQTRR
jgi:type III pantothenate kinase